MANLKVFLESCTDLGLVRLICTNGGAVLEVRTVIQKLYYAELPKGKYANMHTEDFEFHLNIDRIKSVKFEQGEAKRGNFSTYAIRLLNEQAESDLSIFLQWVKSGEYAPGQIEHWQKLKAEYGEVWTPEPLTEI